jgi:hypothetical protein
LRNRNNFRNDTGFLSLVSSGLQSWIGEETLQTKAHAGVQLTSSIRVQSQFAGVQPFWNRQFRFPWQPGKAAMNLREIIECAQFRQS